MNTLTPRYGHDPIRMRLVGGVKQLVDRGDFYWILSSPGLDEAWWYSRPVPDGCRALVVALPTDNSQRGWDGSLWTIGYRNPRGWAWTWTGSEAAPTLQPSLHWEGHWHGWVRAGHLVEA